MERQTCRKKFLKIVCEKIVKDEDAREMSQKRNRNSQKGKIGSISR
jgi:hypothetical protein